MKTAISPSAAGPEPKMGIGTQASYEKRLADEDGQQVQALLLWKNAVLATLNTVIRPPSAVISRKTVDTAAIKPGIPSSALHIATEEKQQNLPLDPFNNTISGELAATSQSQPGIQTLSQLRVNQALAHKVLDILQAYARHTEPDVKDSLKWLGREKFFPQVIQHIQNQQPIRMILPSFPWKSINRVDKVIGALPDLGEELALARLNALCVDIGKVYAHGAEVHIATDGLVFNDVVGISDDDTWEYSVALMDMAALKGFTGIKLLRVMDLLGYTDRTLPLTKSQYLALVKKTRAEVDAQFGNPDKDIKQMIRNDKDTLITYRGFIRFLETDLRYSPVAAHSRSGHHYRQIVKEVAMKMMVRAESFTKIIQAKCPDYIRLSIHPSSGAVKLSIPLLIEKNNPTRFPRTPWHSSIAVSIDGSYSSVHSKDVHNDYDLVMKDGRPWCFREKSDLFDLGTNIEIEHLYPCGLEVRPLESQTGDIRLNRTAVRKLAKLARLQPVRLVGFADMT